MKITKIKGYQCPRCESIYEESYDAESCCPNEANEVNGWKCPECEEIYNDKELAKECCEY